MHNAIQTHKNYNTIPTPPIETRKESAYTVTESKENGEKGRTTTGKRGHRERGSSMIDRGKIQ
jgi:hypothetical protein